MATLSMLKSEKVATPSMAATVVVPDRVLLVLREITKVMLVVASVTLLLSESNIST